MGELSAGLPGYGSGKKKKAKKKKESKSIGGFIANLAGTTGDLLTGLATSPYYLGKAGYHDAKDALNGGDFNSELYGMGKAAISGISDYYSPLVHGEFSKFGNNVYKNPTQILLDAATIATLGGAGAGAVGAKVAQGASAGSRAAKIGEAMAGLDRVAAGTTLTSLQRAKALKAADGAMLVPHNKLIVSNVTGKVLRVDPNKLVARNLVVRARNNMVDSILQKAPARHENPSNTNRAISYFNPEERAARLFKADNDRMARRAGMKQTKNIMIGLDAIPEHERLALTYRVPGFRAADTYKQLVSAKSDLLKQHKETIKNPSLKRGEKVKLERNIASLTDELDGLKRPEVRDAITGKNISDSALQLQQQLLDLSDLNQMLYKRRGKGTETTSLDRSRVPLEAVGASHLVPDDMRIGTISYSEPRLPGARKSKGRSVKGRVELGHDKQMGIDAPSFMNGLYRRDPKKIVEQYAQEMNGVRSLQDFNYMLQVAEPFNANTHANQIGRGYEQITPSGVNSDIAKNINELAAFYQERIAPTAIKAGDEHAIQLSKLIGDWAEEVNKEGGLVVPSAVVRQLRGEVAKQKGIVRTALEKPTKLWRDLTLSLKGSFYVNNALGNLLMGFVGYGPEYLKEILTGGHTIKRGKLSRAVDEALPDVSHQGGLQVLRDVAETETSFRGGMSNPLNWAGVLGDKFAGIGVKFTEENFRKAGLAIEIKKDARRIVKNEGGTVADAVESLLNDTQYVDGLLESVAGKMLDYSKLTPFERDVVRTAYPFWNFTRSITGRAIKLTLDEPWKVQVMNEMSKVAARENDQGMFSTINGEVPPYLKGLAQTGKPDKNGNYPVVSLYAANPFSAAGDMANQVASLASGEVNQATQSPLSSMNPYIKSGFEALLGRDLFFDSPLTGSKTSIYTSQLAKQFPQYGFYQKARYPNSNAVVQRNGQQIAGQYMGLSTGTFSPAMMNRQLAINDYYRKMEEAAALKRKAKIAASDRGPAFGLIDAARGKVGV